MSRHYQDLASHIAQGTKAPIYLGYTGTAVAGTYNPENGFVDVNVGQAYSDFIGGSVVPANLMTPQIGDQYAPQGGERVILIPTLGGWWAVLHHEFDDSPQVPMGERHILHAKVGTLGAGNTPEWDGGVKLTNDGPAEGDGLGGSELGNDGALTRVKTKNDYKSEYNDTDQSITHSTPGGMSGKYDDTAQQITHSPTSDLSILSRLDALEKTILHQASSAVYTIFDGAGNTISHVVPSGGLVALGALASALGDSTLAALRNTDLSTFENSLKTMRLNDLSNLATAVATALAGASPPVTISASAIIALIASLAHISVPNGSSLVRVAS